MKPVQVNEGEGIEPVGNSHTLKLFANKHTLEGTVEGKVTLRLKSLSGQSVMDILLVKTSGVLKRRINRITVNNIERARDIVIYSIEEQVRWAGYVIYMNVRTEDDDDWEPAPDSDYGSSPYPGAG